MELTEPIESINRQLVDLFGVDTVTGQAMWRVVFSEEQFEKRFGTYDDYTPAGIYLRTVTEVREVPKYSQWVQRKYVLERLTVIPEVNKDDLPTSKISYEPMYVFENKKGEALPPRVDVCKVVIDTVYAAMGKKSMAKYVDDYSQYTQEEQDKKIKELEEYLFDPSQTADNIVVGQGIVVPHSYGDTKESH